MLVYFTSNSIEVDGEKCEISFSIPDKDFFLHFHSGCMMKFRKNRDRDFSLVEFDFRELKPIISSTDYGRLCIDFDDKSSRVWLNYSSEGPTIHQALECVNTFNDWEKMPGSALLDIYEKIRIYFPAK